MSVLNVEHFSGTEEMVEFYLLKEGEFFIHEDALYVVIDNDNSSSSFGKRAMLLWSPKNLPTLFCSFFLPEDVVELAGDVIISNKG